MPALGRKGGAVKDPLQHSVEEDLDRIGLDQWVAGKGASDLSGLGQVPLDVQLAAVVILVKAGGGGDAHLQQPRACMLSRRWRMKSVAQASCTPVMPREAIRVEMAGRICSYWAAARSSLASAPRCPAPEWRCGLPPE